MARSLALVAGWLVAAGVALAISWQGVAIVADQVTDRHPAPLTAGELSEGGGTPPSTSPSSSASTSTTAVDQPAGETRTYNVAGGSAALRFEATGVTVVWATPNPGFGVQTEQQGNGVRVEFESESHRSRVEGWWADGPQQRVREDGEDVDLDEDDDDDSGNSGSG